MVKIQNVKSSIIHKFIITMIIEDIIVCKLGVINDKNIFVTSKELGIIIKIQIIK